MNFIDNLQNILFFINLSKNFNLTNFNLIEEYLNIILEQSNKDIIFENKDKLNIYINSSK